MRSRRTILLALTLAAPIVFVGCPSDEADDGVGDDDVGDDDVGDDDSQADDDDASPNPGDPIVLLDTYDGSSFAELLEIETWGDRVAFCSGVQGLNLYDAADPADLQLLDTIGFSVGSPQYPRCQHLAIDTANDLIYVTNRGDQIQPTPFVTVIDASSPGQLSEVGFVMLDHSVEGVAVTDDHLLIAAHDSGLLVFTRGAAGELSPLSTAPLLTEAWHVQVVDELAYVANGSKGLATVDLADPDAPEVIHELDLPGVAKDLDLDGDRAFAALGAAGVALISLDDPRIPALIEAEDTHGSAVALAFSPGAASLAVADWAAIRVFDVSDRDDMVRIGHEPLPLSSSADSRTLGIAMRDTFVFSSNWTEMASYEVHPDRTAPDLVLDSNILSLPDADTGETASDFIIARNEGTEPLTISDADLTEDLTLEGLPLTLDPDDAGTMVLTYSADDGTAYSGQVTLISDDPDEPELPILVEVNITGLNVGDELPSAAFQQIGGPILYTDDLAGTVFLLSYFSTF